MQRFLRRVQGLGFGVLVFRVYAALVDQCLVIRAG